MIGIHFLPSGRQAIRAALVFVLLGGLGLPLRAAHAQDADPRIPLTVRNGEGDVFTLTLGLAPEASIRHLGNRSSLPSPPLTFLTSASSTTTSPCPGSERGF